MDDKKKFIADFHIHSHYSLATSKNLVPEYLEYWAKIKGIDVIGTGDCIHPGWLSELKEKLEPTESGLFQLKKEYKREFLYKKNISNDIFFILSGEVSNIYKKDGKVRKVHNLCVFPDFKAVEYVQNKLKGFNIESDGRPILGLDSKHLLEIVLQSSEKSFLVPAHIWTPWFSVLGSKSGFDSIKECYEDLTGSIFALETGLSSDPAMNWTCPFLDDFKLISNSDAHSPEKLGREANIFETDLSYDGIHGGLKGDNGFCGTIEFFPQEGKYHYDGHRKCGTCFDPLETLAHNGLCPVCGKPVTKGVMYRVAELAERESSEIFANKRNFYSITPLPDLLAELMNKKNSSAKNVQSEYSRLISRLGPEFHILLFSEPGEIRDAGGELLSECISRLRSGKVLIEEGYDGEYGRVKVFEAGEIESLAGTSLFMSGFEENKPAKEVSSSIKFNIKEFQKIKNKLNYDISLQQEADTAVLNPDQTAAIGHYRGPCMVLAGPGSGKTRILTERVIHLIEEKKIKPENILAVTFSNKAADEIRERIQKKNPAINAFISTFHAFGLSVLKSHYKYFERPEHFYIIDAEEKQEIITEMEKTGTRGKQDKKTEKKMPEIERFKQGTSDEIDPALYHNYNRELVIRGAFDLDDLIYLPIELFHEKSEIIEEYRNQYQWILVDEYQDINAKQYELLTMLAGENNPNIFAIGDPDQSIYGFRGSSIKYIDRLKEQYPDMKTIKLSKSYRCPSVILKGASQILEKKEYLSGRSEKVKINIRQAETDKSEADWIAEEIERMMGGVRSFSMDSGISSGDADEESSFSDFAVLCRTSLMFPALIKAFADHGIAYQTAGTEPFYTGKPFSTIISNFRKTYYHLANTKSSALSGLTETRRLIEKNEAITKILSSIMENTDIAADDRKRMEDFALQYGNDYETFFAKIATRIGVDEYNDKAESVSLLTIHASKGLEFNTVFIPGCEEGIIPFELFGEKEKDGLEEEKRLFYVGMTRTGKNLYLTHAKKRSIKGRILSQQKSRFLDRLEKDLIKSELREKRKKDDSDGQMDLFNAS